MTTADNTDERQSAVHQRLLASYPQTFYFLFAYAFTWLVWVPVT